MFECRQNIKYENEEIYGEESATKDCSLLPFLENNFFSNIDKKFLDCNAVSFNMLRDFE